MMLLFHFLIVAADILLELLVQIGISGEHGFDLHALFAIEIVLGDLGDQPR